MLPELKTWYRNLTPLPQLSIILFANWLLWFASSLLESKIFYNENRSLADHLFGATFMALFMTPLIAWNKVKALFKSRDGKLVTKGADEQP